MEIAGRLWRSVTGWHYFGLALIVLVTVALHLTIINQPQDVMVDEVYYVNDARGIVAGEGQLRAEHPPLGQLLIAASIALVGDTTFGWRILSVVFGSAGIVFFYLICGRLGMSRRVSLIATFLLAFENLTFVQASIAMLDVFCTTFMLAGFWCYLRKSYLLSGVAICLSTLVKLTGALTLPVIAIHWLLMRRDRPMYFSLSMLAAPIFFFATIPVFDMLIVGYPINPISRAREILNVSASITFTKYTNIFASRPWEWVFTPDVMPYYWDPQYLAVVSFTVGVLIIPSMVWMTLLATKRHPVGLFSVLWFATTYLVWIPASIITDRMSYIFYFYPTIGAICLGLGLGISQLLDVGRNHENVARGRAIIAGCWCFMAFHLVLLILLTPLFGFWVSLEAAAAPT
ncbi:MAG: glycosyltransferase family 39 protein [Dehalococcoidia bacterium]|nr:glycosyltransferase family 39 protein [Dehalococcoidia bacterium]